MSKFAWCKSVFFSSPLRNLVSSFVVSNLSYLLSSAYPQNFVRGVSPSAIGVVSTSITAYALFTVFLSWVFKKGKLFQILVLTRNRTFVASDIPQTIFVCDNLHKVIADFLSLLGDDKNTCEPRSPSGDV